METPENTQEEKGYKPSISTKLRRIRAHELKEMDTDAIITFLRQHDTLKENYTNLKIDYDSLKRSYESMLVNRKHLEELEKMRQKCLEYQQQRTWIDKIKYIVKDQDKFLTAKEITELIHHYQPQNHLYGDVQHTVSQHLYIATGYGQIKKIVIKGKSAHFFGLPYFFDETGSIKSKYREPLYL